MHGNYGIICFWQAWWHQLNETNFSGQQENNQDSYYIANSSWENFTVTSYHFGNEKVKNWRRDSNIKANRFVLLNICWSLWIYSYLSFFFRVSVLRESEDSFLETSRFSHLETISAKQPSLSPLFFFLFEQTLSPLAKEQNKNKKYKSQEKPQLQKQSHTLKIHSQTLVSKQTRGRRTSHVPLNNYLLLSPL